MERMFIEIQTYMMKSTNELVQSLQVNTQPSSTNVARRGLADISLDHYSLCLH